MLVGDACQAGRRGLTSGPRHNGGLEDHMLGQLLREVRQRRLILRTVATALAIILVLQAATVAILTMADRRRRSRSAPASFPHGALPEIAVDDNALQIYTYGRD